VPPALVGTDEYLEGDEVDRSSAVDEPPPFPLGEHRQEATGAGIRPADRFV
jgi:hypothetical protein